MGKERASKSSGLPPSTSEQIERELVASVLHKRASGETPTARELQALKRSEAANEHDLRWQYLRTTSKKDYLEASGRQAKVVNDQARRYGIPLLGRTIDLVEVIRWVHDWLAENARKLVTIEAGEDPLMSGGDSPALERYRAANASIAELKLEERRGDLVRRDRLREGLARYARGVRSAGDALRRQFGKDAHDLLNEHLDDAERDALEFVGNINDCTDGTNAADSG